MRSISSSISSPASRLVAAAAVCLLNSLAAPAAWAAEPTGMDTDMNKMPPTAAGTKAPPSSLELFTKLDKDQDGKLTKDEAKVLPAIAEHFDELDKNKDGTLSLDEFSYGTQPDAAK